MSDPAEPAAPPPSEDRPEAGGRWQRLFHRSSEAVFVLNHQRRLVFANAAWERLTGLALRQVRGRGCRPSAAAPPGSAEALLALLAPPADVLRGQPLTVRRHASASSRWDIAFFPLLQDGRFRGLIGKIVPLALPAPRERAPLPNRLLTLRDRLAAWHRLDDGDGVSPEMQRVRDQVRVASQTTEPVWIGGAAGAGKQWTARAIHELGPTRGRSFAALDCRRLPPRAVEQALLGKGGLLVSGAAGSVFLRDPEALPRELQAAICQWLRDSRTASAAAPRLLAGSALALDSPEAQEQLVEAFRFAFTVLTIQLPPLCRRAGEAAALLGQFLHRAAGRDLSALSPEALKALTAYAWPGNLRELFTVLRQAGRRAKSATIEVSDLPWYLHEAPASTPPALPLDALLEQVERRLILLALRWAGNNKSKAAEILAVWRNRLVRRLKELGIEEKNDE